MPSAGETRYTISGDSRQLLGALSAGERAMQRFEAQGNQTFQAVERASTGSARALRTMEQAAVAAGGALSAVLLPALYKGYQRFTTVENATVALARQLGDAGKAAKFMGEILETVKGTPFNLDQFADAAALLVRMGVAAEKVPGYMTAIGEAAAGGIGDANQNVMQLTSAFARIAAMGRVTGEELRTLELTGVPVVQMLKEAGYEVDNSNRNFAKMAISAEEAFDIITRGIMEGGEGFQSFAGSMADLRQNLEGAVGGFKAALARVGERFFKTLQGDGKNLANTIQNINELLDKTGPAMMKFLKPLGDMFERLEKSEGLDKLVGKLKNLHGIMPLVGGSLGLAAGGMLRFADSLPLVGNFIPPFLGKMSLIPVAIFGLLSATEEGREALGEFGEVVTRVARQTAPVLITAAGAIADSMAKIGGPAITAAAQALQALIGPATALAGVATGVVTALSPVLSLVERIPEGLLAFVATLLLVRKGMEVLPGIAGRWVGQLQLSVKSMVAKARASDAGSGAMARYRAAVAAAVAPEKAQQVAINSTTAALERKAAAQMQAARQPSLPTPTSSQLVQLEREPFRPEQTRMPVAIGEMEAATRSLDKLPVAAEKAAGKVGVLNKAFGTLGGGIGALRAGFGRLIGAIGGIAVPITAAILLFDKWRQTMAANAEAGRKAAEAYADMFPTDTVDEMGVKIEALSRRVQTLNAQKVDLSWTDKLVDFVNVFNIGISDKEAEHTTQGINAALKETKTQLEATIPAIKAKIAAGEKDTYADNLREQASEAERVVRNLDASAKQLSDVFQRSYREAQEVAEKRRGADAVVTRNIRENMAAIRDVDKATQRYIDVANRAGVSSGTLAAEQERLVSAYVRNALATSETAVTEEEYLRIRQEATQQVAELAMQEQRARREREAANFTLLASFDLLKDSITTLEKLNERGAKAVQALTPDPSVTAGAYKEVKRQINSLVDEFSRRTQDNAKTLSGFVRNVNLLAKEGHVGFAHELIQMGVEGADLAKEAVARIKSGQGLGNLGKAMSEAAKAAKLSFDKEAVNWGGNFQEMAGKATAKLAPVVNESKDEIKVTLAEFKPIFERNVAEWQTWVNEINDLSTSGFDLVATMLRDLGPEAAGLATDAANAIIGGGNSGLKWMETWMETQMSTWGNKGGPFNEAIDAWKQPAVNKAEALGKAIGDAMSKGALEGWKRMLETATSELEEVNRRIREEEERSQDSGWKDWRQWVGLGWTRHSGGPVPGTGAENVPIWAQAGEWVLSRNQVKAIGRENLERMPKMHSGGPVLAGSQKSMRQAATVRNNGGNSTVISVTIPVSGPVIGRGYDDLQEAVRRALVSVEKGNVDIGVAARTAPRVPVR